MIELHRKILADNLRNQVFQAALKKVIRKGKTTVADMGSGTGFLAFLASKLGAKECYLYEQDPDALALSKELAVLNGITNCRFIEGNSRDIKIPIPVDVVISETLGHYALEENTIETLEDAKRFLKPDGLIIPQKIKQFIALITNDRLIKQIDVWSGIGYDLDFSPARQLSLNNMFIEGIMPNDFLAAEGDVKAWGSIDFRGKNSSVQKTVQEWKPKKVITVYGIGLWWEAELVDGVTLSTSPLEPSTHWRQIFLPFAEPFAIQNNQTLQVKLDSDSNYDSGVRLRWSAILSDAHGSVLKEVAMDTHKGLP